MAVSLLTVKQ